MATKEQKIEDRTKCVFCKVRYASSAISIPVLNVPLTAACDTCVWLPAEQILAILKERRQDDHPF